MERHNNNGNSRDSTLVAAHVAARQAGNGVAVKSDFEIRLQRQGYADAMLDPEVLWAIANGGAEGRIAVAYVEWANASSQDVVVDWMVVEDAATARLFGERLMAAPRLAYGSNAIGAALLKGKELIDGNAFEGWRKVIDLSGDSSWNPQGPSIASARDAVTQTTSARMH